MASAAVVHPRDYVLADKVVKNAETLARMRTFVALVAGIVAGVLGLTGLMGGVFYVIVGLCAGIVYSAVACGGSAGRYFSHNEQGALLSNVTSGALTYVLAWMVAYDCIYVF